MLAIFFHMKKKRFQSDSISRLIASSKAIIDFSNSSSLEIIMGEPLGSEGNDPGELLLASEEELAIFWNLKVCLLLVVTFDA